MKNILVFFGGNSTEHDVSVITGVLTANSVDGEKYSVIPVYVDYDGAWYTGKGLLDLDGYKNFKVSDYQRVCLLFGDKNLYVIKRNKLKKFCEAYCAVNCMHGERGEDGSLAGIMKFSEIPFCSPSVLASSVSMDKTVTKTVMKGLKVPVVRFVTVSEEKLKDGQFKLPFKMPVIVKPNCGGSSIGISKVSDEEDLQSAINFALKFGSEVIIEPCLTDFTEINCAVYKAGGKVRVSECERPIGANEVLTFADKYESGKREFPAMIETALSDKIKEISEKVYDALDFNGIIRIDYFVSSDKKVYLNEINSVPGSLAYYLFSDTLKGFTEMLSEIIEEGRRTWEKGKLYEKKFRTGILSGVKGVKSSKRL